MDDNFKNMNPWLNYADIYGRSETNIVAKVKGRMRRDIEKLIEAKARKLEE